MTVRDNIGFGLKMRHVGRAERDRRVDQALATVRLESQAEKLPGQLSGGQQQRVAIARAIVIEPPLVLMDEPLSNLDAKLRLEMRQEIRRIHAGLGSVTLYVTHDQDEALSLADRIVVLRDGEIRQVGTPEELYMRPAQLDVADFMGFRNRITGRVSKGAQGQVRIEIGPVSLTGWAHEAMRTETAVASLRPDDLLAVSDQQSGAFRATVEAIEYRGRDFFGSARLDDQTEVFFRSHQIVQIGQPVQLAADMSKLLIFNHEA